MNIQKLKDRFFWKNCGRATADFIQKRVISIILVFSLLLVAYAVSVWYRYIYHQEWSEARKQEYLKTKDKGAVFNKARFGEIVSEMEERQKNYRTDMGDLEDIFRLKK